MIICFVFIAALYRIPITAIWLYCHYEKNRNTQKYCLSKPEKLSQKATTPSKKVRHIRVSLISSPTMMSSNRKVSFLSALKKDFPDYTLIGEESYAKKAWLSRIKKRSISIPSMARPTSSMASPIWRSLSVFGKVVLPVKSLSYLQSYPEGAMYWAADRKRRLPQ